MTAPKTVVWPAPGVAEVNLRAADRPGTPSWQEARAGSLPVSIAAPSGALEKARIEVLDRDTTLRAGINGLLIRAGRADGATQPTRAMVKVNYTGFRDAYGGGWPSRLRLVQLPECALSTPEADGCAATPLPSSNDLAAGLVSAEVSLQTEASAGKNSLVALTAAASSDGGNYSATALQPSSSWSAGGQSGDMTWSYPMRMPPGIGGPEPTVGLSYSAQSLDGKTAATNNQPSWIGDGFDYAAGSVDRTYKACVDDGRTGIGDLCWGTDNATLSLPGHAGELIQVSTSPDLWRIKDDDGTKVERLTGTGNGDNNNEYWKVTTPDGTRYFFGLNRLPGSTAAQQTNSVFTVPVFGNDSGEPCYQASGFAASYCDQAYRWHLDYVVDPRGNTMSMWYTKQINRYARNVTASAVSTYVRGGHLDHISYGTRQDTAGSDDLFTAGAPAQVVFTTADRCINPGSGCVESNPSNWPDVPWDQQCNSATNCANIYAPTFFSQKRLASVTTQVRDGTGYRDVERWTLTHAFKDPGDGHPKLLWLDRLARVGLSDGATTTTPDVTFGGIQMNNRVDRSPTQEPIIRFRVSLISNEVGGVLSVNYSAPECVIGSVMPASADNNTKLCYPVYWTPYGQSTPVFDWFHKYVVRSVTFRDNAGGAPTEEHTYTYYSDGPMWHYDTSELIPPAHKSWGQWRGYSKVRTTVGTAGSAQRQTDTTFFRGMNRDKTATGARSVSLPADADVPGSVAVPDDEWLYGQTRTAIVYNGIGDNAPIVSKAVTDPWAHGPTATRTRNGVTASAYMIGEKRTTELVALDGGRGWRRTQTTNTYDTEDGSTDPAGLITRVDDSGDLSTTVDDRCSRTTYAKNVAAHILTAVSRIETVSVNCAVAPSRPADLLSDTRTWYDGATSYNQSITKGDVTKTEVLSDWINGSAVYMQAGRATYDANGRVVEAFDALDRKTTIGYTPTAGGPLTATAVTNALGWTTRTVTDPAYGEPTASTDINGKRTDLLYDGLGRLIAVWKPDRNKNNDTPHLRYTYLLRNSGGPSAVATQSLTTDGTGYRTGWTIYDGQLRNRQTQLPAPGGGRIITDVLYDSRGLQMQQNHAYFNAASPGNTLFIPAGPVPSRTITTYDNSGRATTVVYQVNGVPRWQTSSLDGGDHVDVTAVPGGTGTSTWTNARGQTVELRTYRSNVPTGTFDATKYTYTRSGEMETATDPAGNAWRFRYDLRGNRIDTKDPDRGTSTYTFNELGQQVTVTDARGITLTTGYDELGRRTTLHQGNPATGTKLAQWSYDTLAKGQPTASTRYINGNAYTTAVTGYDNQYRSLGTTVTIPPSEGALANSYTTTSTFNADGSTATTIVPAIGGLPQETITYGYNADGLSTTMRGLTSYVTDTFYDSLGRVGTMNLSDGGTKTLTQVWNYEEGTARLIEHGVLDMNAEKVFQDAWYSYDAAGNVTSIKDLTAQYSAGPDDNQCFQFDHLRRLTEAWTPTDGNCAAAPTQAALDGPAPYWTSYRYDLTGSRTTETDRTKTTAVNRSSTYPTAGPDAVRPHAVTQITNAMSGGATSTDSYSYDAAGNMTTRNRTGKPTQTLTWDAEGHLASISDPSGTTSYIYDASGNRLIANEPGSKTLYLASHEIKATGSTLTATRFYGANAVRTTNGELFWAASDHHGTNTLSFKATDLTVTQRRSTPFGAPRGTDPAWPTTKGFVGGTRDATGLTHLGAREYDPALGRFISADPIFEGSDPQSWNGYAYAHNNPVTISDPSGLADVWELRERAYGSVTRGKPFMMTGSPLPLRL